MQYRDKLYVAPSPIHGKGLFAKAAIKRGTFIGRYEGPRAKRNGKFVLWVTDEKGKTVGWRGTGLLRFLNHRNKPNAEFDGRDLFALRKIAADEEITFDYQWEDD